ncbi:hypothetical protein, partial [Streptomyces sp. NPDC059468]|uniref:hypothetical protein n=1 Tax=Streptomyces sp. NPDC059468 TaxID=3346845 RepID=UPI0036903964
MQVGSAGEAQVNAGVDCVSLQLRLSVRVPISWIGVKADDLLKLGVCPDRDERGRLGDCDLLVPLPFIEAVAAVEEHPASAEQEGRRFVIQLDTALGLLVRLGHFRPHAVVEAVLHWLVRGQRDDVCRRGRAVRGESCDDAIERPPAKEPRPR